MSRLVRSTVAITCLAALGAGCCYEEVMVQVGDGMDQKVDQTLRRMNEAMATASAALEDSVGRYETQYKEYRDLLVDRYNAHHQPCELVFFARDALPSQAPGEEARPGEPTGKPAEPVFKDVEADILTERVLEHRGLQLVWKLGLDGSPARYAFVDGEQLYVVTQQNRIYSIERRTGLTRWLARLPRRPDSPPGFSDAYVVISAGDVIHVIDKFTGRDKWRFETNVQPASRPYCSRVGFVYAQ
jgi:hypothetical protein